MSDLNEIQMQIIKELTFKPSSKFSDIKPFKVTSDKFSYHLKVLQDLNLIEKFSSGEYSLTIEGKKFSGKIDTDKKQVEKQPKVSVLLIVKKFEKNEYYLLIQTRLKEPFFGVKGFPTGKVHWGETIVETADRELFEESGLKSKFKHSYTLHEQVYDKATKEQVEDKLFFVCEGIYQSGEILNGEGCENSWILEKDLAITTPKYPNRDWKYEIYESGFSGFIEHKIEVENF